MSHNFDEDGLFDIKNVLFESPERSLLSVEETTGKKKSAIIEILTYADDQKASVMADAKKKWKNLLSLYYHPAFINPLDSTSQNNSVLVKYESAPGIHLPLYIETFFKGYMADEGFALELTYHLASLFSTIQSGSSRKVIVGGIRKEDVFLAPDGKVKLLPPPVDHDEGEAESRRELLESLGMLLFWMLTLHDPKEEKERLVKARELNLELSPEAEQLIKRSVIPEEDGGFSGPAALKRALYDMLRKRRKEEPLKDGYLSGFRGEKPAIEYETHMKEAVTDEGKFQEKVKKPDFGKDYRVLLAAFRSAHKHVNWGKLWPLALVPYFIFFLPMLFITNERTITGVLFWFFVTFSGYIGIFFAVLYGYRRTIE